jgi:hypothetical protein
VGFLRKLVMRLGIAVRTRRLSKLPDHPVVPDGTFIGRDFVDDKKWHEASCKRYGKWVEHNAWAALSTKNTEGRFGMWWGAPDGLDDYNLDGGVKIPRDAVDYRNLGVPQQWEMPGKFEVRQTDGGASGDGDWFGPRDLNDRGRGRSVETQGGGVSVLRAAWEIIVRGDE